MVRPANSNDLAYASSTATLGGLGSPRYSPTTFLSRPGQWRKKSAIDEGSSSCGRLSNETTELGKRFRSGVPADGYSLVWMQVRSLYLDTREAAHSTKLT